MGLRAACCVPLLFLTSCASIVSHSNWPVTVTSPSPGTMVSIKDEHGLVVHQAPTPFTVTLKSGDGYFAGADYVLETQYGSTPMNSRFNGWYVGNVVFGGLIGMLIVDPLTGAMWRLPETVTVPGGPVGSP